MCIRDRFYLSLLGLVGIGLLALVSFDPQDLSDVDGYVEDSSAVIPGGPNLVNLLENAARNKNGVRLTEEQINNYIRRTLKFEQGGWFESFVTARGVWVRLQENVVEVIIEREVWGKRHTISMLLEPEQTAQEDGGINTTVSRGKGKWGRAILSTARSLELGCRTRTTKYRMGNSASFHRHRQNSAQKAPS